MDDPREPKVPKVAVDGEAGPSSETSPLLPRSNSLANSADIESKSWHRFHISNPFRVEVIHPRFKSVPLLVAVIILANESDFYLKHVPVMRMIESLRCIEYYQVHDPTILDRYGYKIPERLCNSPVVEEQVAKTAGLIIFFLMTRALLGAVPLDLTYPRMPIGSMYFSGALAMTGGNFDFGLAIFVASITDVVPSHSDRVSIFFILSSMLFVAQLICPPLGGILLDLDGEGGTPWVPYLIADAFMICAAILCIVAYPETLQTSSQEPQQGPGEESPTNVESSQAKITAFCHQRLDKVKSGWTYFRSSCAGLGLSSLFILGVAMLCFTIGVKSIDWYGLMQYATWKLKWGASETTITLSLQAFINILTFSILIPHFIRTSSRLLKNSAGSLATLIASTLILSIGVVIIGVSTNTPVFILGVIYTTGEGFAVALQAYISSLVSRDSTALVLSTLSMAQTGGKLLAAILFPKVLTFGLDTGVDVLVGLPCFAAAGLFLVAAVCVGVHAAGL